MLAIDRPSLTGRLTEPAVDPTKVVQRPDAQAVRPPLTRAHMSVITTCRSPPMGSASWEWAVRHPDRQRCGDGSRSGPPNRDSPTPAKSSASRSSTEATGVKSRNCISQGLQVISISKRS